MDATQFVGKWQKAQLTERSAYQQHFLDLCDLLGHGKPAALDPKGEFFTFERGVSKSTGRRGWADVWKRNYFAIEYKGKHKNLDEAYDQLLLYRASLENPPLLAVCDTQPHHHPYQLHRHRREDPHHPARAASYAGKPEHPDLDVPRS